MKINAITVCVNYSQHLMFSLPKWKATSDRLVVVTTEADHLTQDLCIHDGVEFYTTDIFYRNGAKFNKGAALSEAIFKRDLLAGDRDTWLMVFDADIVPPDNLRSRLRGPPFLQPETLYGAERYRSTGTVYLLPDFEKKYCDPDGVVGFFLMINTLSPCLYRAWGDRHPVFDLCWPHAGNYDTAFINRWPKDRRMVLPIPMVHLGEDAQNWMGTDIDSRQQLDDLFAQRRVGRSWQMERMHNPPRI